MSVLIDTVGFTFTLTRLSNAIVVDLNLSMCEIFPPIKYPICVSSVKRISKHLTDDANLLKFVFTFSSTFNVQNNRPKTAKLM